MRQQLRPTSRAAVTAAFRQAGDPVRSKAGSGRWALRPPRMPGLLPVMTMCAGVLAGCGPSSTAPSSGSIAAIVISPDSISLATGSSRGLSAQARSESGASLSAGKFFWSTSDSLVATVDQSGVVVAHEPGAAQIGASAEGMTGLARVIVVEPLVKTVVITPASDTIYASQPGDTATLSATGYDAAGSVIGGSQVLWSINSALATVSGGTVVGTNTGVGTVTVTATSPDSGYPAGTASVLVIGHIANTAVSPAYSFLSTSGFSWPNTVQVTATLTDTFGNNVTGQRVLSWTTSNPSVATVDSHGLVTAVSTTDNEAEITATTPDGSSGTMTVTVFP